MSGSPGALKTLDFGGPEPNEIFYVGVNCASSAAGSASPNRSRSWRNHRSQRLAPDRTPVRPKLPGGANYATSSRRPPALNATGRTTRNALGRTTRNAIRRTIPSGPGRAKCAMEVVRNATPAVAWRYPTRTPARVMKPRPPAPGKAAAASAHSETGSRISPKTCRKDDPAPIGNVASGATGAIPDTADARPGAITSSGATPVASPVTGRPETPASGGPEIPGKWQGQRQSRRHRRTRGCRRPRAVDACHFAQNGLHPGDAQQEGQKVEGQLREQDGRTGNRAEHLLNQRGDIRNRRHHHIRNRRALVRNRGDRFRNPRRRHLRNSRDLVRNRGTELRVVFRDVRAARLGVRLFRAGGMLLA